MALGNSLNFLAEFLWDAHPQTCVLQVELCGVSQRWVCGFYMEEGGGNGQRRGNGLAGKADLQVEGWKVISGSVDFWVLEPSL